MCSGVVKVSGLWNAVGRRTTRRRPEFQAPVGVAAATLHEKTVIPESPGKAIEFLFKIPIGVITDSSKTRKEQLCPVSTPGKATVFFYNIDFMNPQERKCPNSNVDFNKV